MRTDVINLWEMADEILKRKAKIEVWGVRSESVLGGRLESVNVYGRLKTRLQSKL